MLPRDVLATARAEAPLTTMDGSDAEALSAAEWLLSDAAGRRPEVRRYLFFLKWTYETFHAIAESFPKENPGRAGAKDASAMASSPAEMLHLANHLYLLASHEVDGAVLECGCFKGFSACCLSHTCAWLGRELIVADSFAGLPSPGPGEESFYRPGDFTGTLAEVQENLSIYGRPDCVRFRQGWFAESLRGWSRPLALLWLDVDLYRSTLDVLENVFPALDRRGALFSHEFLADRVQDGKIVQAGEPSGALRDYFEERSIAYEACWIGGWTGRIDFPASVGHGADRLVAALLPELRDRDHRARAAPAADSSRQEGLRGRLRRARSKLLGPRGALLS